MIPQYNGMKAEQTVFSNPLPKGGYVANIINAKIEDYPWGSVLVIAFDIAEGDYKDFFRKQFKLHFCMIVKSLFFRISLHCIDRVFNRFSSVENFESIGPVMSF